MSRKRKKKCLPQVVLIPVLQWSCPACQRVNHDAPTLVANEMTYEQSLSLVKEYGGTVGDHRQIGEWLPPGSVSCSGCQKKFRSHVED